MELTLMTTSRKPHPALTGTSAIGRREMKLNKRERGRYSREEFFLLLSQDQINRRKRRIT